MNREHVAAAASLLLAVSAASCSGSSTPSDNCGNNCPLATITAHLVSGSVTWSADTVTQHTVPLIEVPVATGATSTPNTCTISDLQQIISSTGAIIAFGPSIDCPAPTGNDDLTLFMKGLADSRDFPMGTSILTASEAELALEYVEISPDGGKPLCDPGLQNVQLTLTVDNATGSWAPYPQLVSRPYRRSYKVDLDTGPLTDTACGTIAVHVTAQFVQADADVVYNPHGPCTCI